jgi:hypothetical protein
MDPVHGLLPIGDSTDDTGAAMVMSQDHRGTKAHDMGLLLERDQIASSSPRLECASETARDLSWRMTQGQRHRDRPADGAGEQHRDQLFQGRSKGVVRSRGRTQWLR